MQPSANAKVGFEKWPAYLRLPYAGNSSTQFREESNKKP